MDLKLYLVDILFTLSIYEETKDNGTNEFAFGNVFSKALNNVENIENPFYLKIINLNIKNGKIVFIRI